MYDLTIFKLRCGLFTLKIYTKGERVLRERYMALEQPLKDQTEFSVGTVLQRTCVYLSVEGLRYREIAAILGVRK